MKHIISLIILFCEVLSTYSQSDSFLLKNYEQKILEINKLRSDLETSKQQFSNLSNAYKKDTLAFQKQIKELLNEVSSEKQKVAALSKNELKKERDYLKFEVDSQSVVISKQHQSITEKEKLILNEKSNVKATAARAKEDGKNEILLNIINFYQNRPFDSLIKSTTQESISRDIKLLANYPEIKPLLNDLQIYFNAKKLLSEKFDSVKIKNSQIQLDKISRSSQLLNALKVDINSYYDNNRVLKETLYKLIELDKRKSSDGDATIQKLKFNDVMSILTDYMYNYYEYHKYPYLSNCVLEIIKQKRLNADEEMKDLLLKL